MAARGFHKDKIPLETSGWKRKRSSVQVLSKNVNSFSNSGLFAALPDPQLKTGQGLAVVPRHRWALLGR